MEQQVGDNRKEGTVSRRLSWGAFVKANNICLGEHPPPAPPPSPSPPLTHAVLAVAHACWSLSACLLRHVRDGAAPSLLPPGLRPTPLWRRVWCPAHTPQATPVSPPPPLPAPATAGDTVTLMPGSHDFCLHVRCTSPNSPHVPRPLTPSGRAAGGASGGDSALQLLAEEAAAAEDEVAGAAVAAARTSKRRRMEAAAALPLPLSFPGSLLPGAPLFPGPIDLNLTSMLAAAAAAGLAGLPGGLSGMLPSLQLVGAPPGSEGGAQL